MHTLAPTHEGNKKLALELSLWEHLRFVWFWRKTHTICVKPQIVILLYNLTAFISQAIEPLYLNGLCILTLHLSKELTEARELSHDPKWTRICHFAKLSPLSSRMGKVPSLPQPRHRHLPVALMGASWASCDRGCAIWIKHVIFL